MGKSAVFSRGYGRIGEIQHGRIWPDFGVYRVECISCWIFLADKELFLYHGLVKVLFLFLKMHGHPGERCDKVCPNAHDNQKRYWAT